MVPDRLATRLLPAFYKPWDTGRGWMAQMERLPSRCGGVVIIADAVDGCFNGRNVADLTNGCSNSRNVADLINGCSNGRRDVAGSRQNKVQVAELVPEVCRA
jgi:hypothetical protein